MTRAEEIVAPITELTRLPRALVQESMEPNSIDRISSDRSLPVHGGILRYLSRTVIVAPGGRRPPPGPQVTDVQSVAELLRPMALLDVEHKLVLSYDERMRLICAHLVGLGDRDQVSFMMRDVLKVPLLVGAFAAITVHNHPTSTTRPSMADKRSTLQELEAFARMGIDHADHIIISPHGFYSFRQGQSYKWDGNKGRRWNPMISEQSKRRWREATKSRNP